MEIFVIIGIVVFLIWAFSSKKTTTTSKPSQSSPVVIPPQKAAKKKEESLVKPQPEAQSKSVEPKLTEDFQSVQAKINFEQEAKTKQEALQKQEKLKRLEIQKVDRFKEDWSVYKEIITRNEVNCLYHFTDRSNINSILENEALFSWSYCLNNNITIPSSGGDGLSRSLDSRYNLENYVRLSFTRNHPMMFVAQNQGRIVNPVILEVDPEVIYWKSSKYSDKNATRNDVRIGETVSDFNRIRFDIVKQKNHFDLIDLDKPYYQAEILVLEKLPIKYIRNIHTFRNISTQLVTETDDLPF